MSKIKALITMLVLGTSSAAMADSYVTARVSARGSFHVGAPLVRPVAPEVRDHRLGTTAVYDNRIESGWTHMNVSGVYSSPYGTVNLRQVGNRIAGSYPGGGTLEGRVFNGRIVFKWSEPAGTGSGVWMIRRGRLEGSWGWNASSYDGGRWDLKLTSYIR